MKKLLVMAMTLCLFASCALADVSEDIYWDYMPYAETFGAPLFEKDGITFPDPNKDTGVAKAGAVTIFFEITPTNAIRTVIICAEDEAGTADFLCSCVAMISFLGGMDFKAFGGLISNFGMRRGGSVSAPVSVGIDSFSLTTMDDYELVFYYANNDLKTN